MLPYSQKSNFLILDIFFAVTLVVSPIPKKYFPFIDNASTYSHWLIP